MTRRVLTVLSQSSTSRSVSENSLTTSIGIAAPVDTSFGSAALTVMVAALPSTERFYFRLRCRSRRSSEISRDGSREYTPNGPSGSLVQERSGSDASRASANGPLAGLSSFVTATPRLRSCGERFLSPIHRHEIPTQSTMN